MFSALIDPRSLVVTAPAGLAGARSANTMSDSLPVCTFNRKNCCMASASPNTDEPNLVRKLKNANSTPRVTSWSWTPAIPIPRNSICSDTPTMPVPVSCAIDSLPSRMVALVASAKCLCQCASLTCSMPSAFTTSQARIDSRSELFCVAVCTIACARSRLDFGRISAMIRVESMKPATDTAVKAPL